MIIGGHDFHFIPTDSVSLHNDVIYDSRFNRCNCSLLQHRLSNLECMQSVCLYNSFLFSWAGSKNLYRLPVHLPIQMDSGGTTPGRARSNALAKKLLPWLAPWLTEIFTFGPSQSSQLMTCLTTVLTWKWPGCLDVLAPPLQMEASNNLNHRMKIEVFFI